MSSSIAVKRNNSLETPSAILMTEKYPCAIIAIREDISNKRVVPSLPTRKAEQRNTVITAKAAITVERAITIARITNRNVMTMTALTTKDRARKEETMTSTYGMGKPGDNKISGCFSCGSKDHRKSDCPKMKKTTHWKDDVNMLGFFPEDKEEVNSLSESLEERVFIDTCASLGIFLVSLNGEKYLQRVEVLQEPISLGLTDMNSSMKVHKLGSYNDWHNIMVCHTSRKSIIAADKIAARGYTIFINGEVKIFKESTLIMTCAKENGMPWVFLKDLLEVLNEPEQDQGPFN
jgi:hypothetical protein